MCQKGHPNYVWPFTICVLAEVQIPTHGEGVGTRIGHDGLVCVSQIEIVPGNAVMFRNLEVPTRYYASIKIVNWKGSREAPLYFGLWPG